jgi:hypothetical protein
MVIFNSYVSLTEGTSPQYLPRNHQLRNNSDEFYDGNIVFQMAKSNTGSMCF